MRGDDLLLMRHRGERGWVGAWPRAGELVPGPVVGRWDDVAGRAAGAQENGRPPGELVRARWALAEGSPVRERGPSRQRAGGRMPSAPAPHRGHGNLHDRPRRDGGWPGYFAGHRHQPALPSDGNPPVECHATSTKKPGTSGKPKSTVRPPHSPLDTDAVRRWFRPVSISTISVEAQSGTRNDGHVEGRKTRLSPGNPRRAPMPSAAAQDTHCIRPNAHRHQYGPCPYGRETQPQADRISLATGHRPAP